MFLAAVLNAHTLPGQRDESPLAIDTEEASSSLDDTVRVALPAFATPSRDGPIDDSSEEVRQMRSRW
jgi:hypothetical protein